MISQFNQPRGSTSIEVNKQSIARNFGVKENEVVYFTAGIDLGGFKVIYDESTQRAYSLPALATGITAVSLTADGTLVHSGGNVDLGALAVEREEFINASGSFTTGATLIAKNELLMSTTGKYRWAGAFPKVVPANSTPASSGGFGSTAWLQVKENITFAPSIAALRTIEPAGDGQSITLKEHTVNTGYGGGRFRSVLDGSSYTDNNGTVIKTTGGAVWLRINADIINPLMFGAIPDGVTDCSTAFMNALSAGSIFVTEGDF